MQIYNRSVTLGHIYVNVHQMHTIGMRLRTLLNNSAVHRVPVIFDCLESNVEVECPTANKALFHVPLHYSTFSPRHALHILNKIGERPHLMLLSRREITLGRRHHWK